VARGAVVKLINDFGLELFDDLAGGENMVGWMVRYG
jgi:hypothetical protein